MKEQLLSLDPFILYKVSNKIIKSLSNITSKVVNQKSIIDNYNQISKNLYRIKLLNVNVLMINLRERVGSVNV